MEDILHDYLIADTNIFLNTKGSVLHKIAHHIVTVDDVKKEIKDEVSRHRFETLPYELEIVEPTPEDVSYVVRFSKETGDYRSLSMPDIRVIALAVRYVKEKLPFMELAKQPGQSRRILTEDEKQAKIQEIQKQKTDVQPNTNDTQSLTWSKPTEDIQVSNDPLFPSLDKLGTKMRKPKVTTVYDYDPNEEVEDKKFNAFEQQNNNDIPSSDEDDDFMNYNDYEDEPVDGSDEEEEEEDVVEFEEDQERVNENDDNSNEEEDTKETKHQFESIEVYVTPSPVEKKKEVEVDDDGFITKDKDFGFTEWITPSNYRQLQKKTSYETRTIKPLRVVCMTADYAMQNVLMQMGIRVMSVDGKFIHKIMKWMLKCVICHEQIFDMSKQFCPKCGYHDLRKISYYTLSNGKIKENFNVNKTLSKRGRVYAVPNQSNSKGKGIILTEDVYNQRLKKATHAAKRKDGNGFTSRQVAEKSVQIEMGRKNPNVSRKKIGKKNKSIQK
ncbi:RNA-binding protein nob1 [Entamoeba marina]